MYNNLPFIWDFQNGGPSHNVTQWSKTHQIPPYTALYETYIVGPKNLDVWVMLALEPADLRPNQLLINKNI